MLSTRFGVRIAIGEGPLTTGQGAGLAYALTIQCDAVVPR